MSDVSDSLDKLFNTVVKDELGVTKPVADSYLSDIIANPAQDNIVAKSLAFEASAIALLPNMAAAAAKDTAASLKALLDLEADKLTGATPGTTAAAAVAA